MHNFVLFCKTYCNDVKRVEKLISSYKKHNKENIPLYLSVPKLDHILFKKFEDENIKVITDESYAENYFARNSTLGIEPGYINQEICKLCFWEAGYTQNYLCVDSDVYFIKDFSVSDFMYNEHTPYTVLVMDKDLSIEKHYQEFWDWRMKNIKKIFDYVELEDPRLKTCHGMQVLSSKVLKSFKDDFLGLKGLGYKDILDISPYEFTWYNVWLQKTKIIDIIEVEPFFKTFHHRIEYILSRFKLLNEKDYAKAYVGVILNSNWKPKKPPLEYEEPGIVHKIMYKIFQKL